MTKEMTITGIEENKNEIEKTVVQEIKESEKFTKEELEQIEKFAKEIDLTNSNLILEYGAGSQKKIVDFSDAALQKVRNKDMGEIGNLLTNLVTELKHVNDTEKGIKGFFNRGTKKIDRMKAKYTKSEANVDKVAEALEVHQATLIKDITLMDKLFEKSKEYFKEISMYIAAGKIKLEEVRNNDLVELRKRAEETGLPEDAQAADDLASMCDRFEKKIYDLESTRAVALLNGPQIRMVQNNDTVMSEKIQSTLVNTLPLWKSQMVLALGIAHSKEAAEAQKMVSQATNDMLKKNADMLKTATVETAKESERGIVDIETLEHTNQQLISTIDEVLQIQEDGRQKRTEAEKELNRIEDELREKMLQSSENAKKMLE